MVAAKLSNSAGVRLLITFGHLCIMSRENGNTGESTERDPLIRSDELAKPTQTNGLESGIQRPDEQPLEQISTKTIWGVLSTLMLGTIPHRSLQLSSNSLLGVFIASADGSLVIATSSEIASEFHRLSEASWLVTAYTLGQCAFQPLVSCDLARVNCRSLP
jgi:hypothetical protein